MRLVDGSDVVYGKVKEFLRDHFYEGSPVDLEDPGVPRYLSEPEPGKILFDSLKRAIHSLTLEERGTSRVEDWIRQRDMRPFRTKPRRYLAPKRSFFTKSDGDLAPYVQDFPVKSDDGKIFVIETKGREELDLPQKMARLRQWCGEATVASLAAGGPAYRQLFVDQEGFETHQPTSFQGLVETSREYQA